MATTSNYGWTTPDDTSLVKDGASAIRTLGSAIDTSLNTALGTKKAGLVLLNTTSFSGVASQSINDVFSATYDNYLILIDDVIKNTSAGDLALYFRLRVSATDSTANYTWGQNYALYASATTGASNLNNGGYFLALAANATNKSATQLAIQNPFLAKPTTMQSLATMHDAGSYIAGHHSASTSYTGFSLVAASGTMTTGRITVYGYNK